MSRVSAVFQISIYGLVSIASLMLAIAEGAFLPQCLTPPLAVLAYFLVERSRSFALPILAANSLGLVAFAAAGWEFFDENIEGRILSGAHLLVYLTVIVMFQKKDNLQYWWMCALSVLMVAVGSVLTNDETYGMLLLGFMVYSIWTLSVFSLHQAQQQFGETVGQENANAGATNSAVPGLTVAAPGGNGNGAQIASWLKKPSAARGTIRHDPNESWFSTQFLATNVGTSIGAMVISALFFLFIPRLWAGRTDWESTRNELRPRAMSGFTPEVRLGDFGEVLSSAAKVLEVRLFDNETNRPIDVEAYTASIGLTEPLFRGTVMGDYQKGTWSGLDRRTAIFRELPSRPPDGMVRQEIHMEPIGTDILFAISPVRAGRIANQPDDLDLLSMHQVLFRPQRIAVDKPIAYAFYSPRNRVQVRGNERDWRMFFGRRPGPELARLTAKAREIAGYSNRQGPPPAERAARIHDHLRYSGIYSYSLDTSIDDFSIDPVEDFLFNRKKGHCEYFATSLALMLRAVDIPARLVSGFKGGKVNAISGHFEVEQRHAHAWVEAYIDGVSVTLDPTPEAREESVESFAASMQTAHDLASFMKGTWSRYVVNMDINQQNNNFYDPIKKWWQNQWNSDTGLRAQLIGFGRAVESFVTDPRQWFSVKGAGITFVLLLAGAGIYRLGRRYPSLWNFFRKLLRRDRDSRRIRVAFYERFENLCLHLGLVRAPAQTQREFAEVAAQRILSLPPNGQLGDLPSRVVRQFYRVRFGTEELAPQEVERIDKDLTSLEHAIIHRHGRR